MIYLVLDTETTGLPNKGLKAIDPLQARVVQLALKLVTDSGRVIQQFSTLIKPSGWLDIHPKAFEAHGISKEDCERWGIPCEVAFGQFCLYAKHADMVVAHNADFDETMMMLEADAQDCEMPGIPWHCTMKAAVNICKVPPTPAMVRAGRTGYKNPNLTEALEILCGEKMVGAHDAMNDVNACTKIMLELKRRKAA